MRVLLWMTIVLGHVACQKPVCQSDEDSACVCDSAAEDEYACDDPPEKPLDGAKLYKMYCYQCHANEGQGSGAGLDIRERVLTSADDELLDIILNGQGRMEPILVDEDEGYAIIEWVKSAFALPESDE